MAERAAGLRGDDLSDAQKDKLGKAAQDMMLSMPVRALAPDMAKGIEERLNDAGYDVENLGDKRLSDLGEVGSEVARDAVKNLKANRPGLFYGMSGTLAVGAAAAAYDRGSKGLKSLGLDPKVSTSLGSNTKLDLRANWTRHFVEGGGSADVSHRVNDRLTLRGGASGSSDGGLTALRLGLDHNTVIGGGSVATKVRAEAKGEDLATTVRINNTISRGDFRLANGLVLDEDGIASGRSTLTYKDALDGTSTFDARLGRDAKLEQLGASYSISRELESGVNFYAKGSAGYDLRNDSFNSSLSAGYQKDNLDIGVVAGRNQDQGNYVGVGLKFNF